MCEIMMKQVRTDLLLEGQDDMAQRIMSYRSGYSALQRREIEQEMFSGKLLGVIATTGQSSLCGSLEGVWGVEGGG